ncbi:hypothetical protein D3C87_490590 [compost metagenome]
MDNFKSTTMAYQPGPFLKAFLITIGVILSIIVSVNYLVDPYWYKDHRIKDVNSLPINDIANYAPLMNTFRLYSKGPKVKFSIIGTSHISLGIPGNYPFLEKIAVNTMNIDESSEVLQKILEEASVQKTIFIEMCGNNPTPLRKDIFCNDLFSLRTTFNSIRTIKLNLLNNQSLTSTLDSINTRKIDTSKSINELNSKLAPMRPLNNNEIASIKKMHKITFKNKKHLTHQVIFFLPPLPLETMKEEKYKRLNAKIALQLQKEINSMQIHNSLIKFKFLNLVGTEIGNEYQFGTDNFYDGWYDSTHFKPIIGDQVIKYLMDHK